MADLITLTCPSCGAKTVSTTEMGRFHCEYCGNDHLLKGQIQPVERTAAPIRPKIPIPECVRIEKDGKSAVIYQRWFTPKYIPMAFFCVAWDGFLCFWYSMAIGGNAPWIFIVFPIAHLAIGIGMTYSTLAGFFNRTCLELTRDELAVWFEPLPWLGEKKIKTSEIQQLFCRETVHQGKRTQTSQYHLYAVTRAGHQAKLLSNIESPDVALYLEQQLEDWLRIEDQPVVGALAL